MATEIRTELSESNPHYIEKHRYLELRNFCLQYPIWEKAYNSLLGLKSREQLYFKPTERSDPTLLTAMAISQYSIWMDLVRDAADQTDPVLSEYIFEAVTKGLTYDKLNAKHTVPCCRKVYYEKYREFFWILSHSRN